MGCVCGVEWSGSGIAEGMVIGIDSGWCWKWEECVWFWWWKGIVREMGEKTKRGMIRSRMGSYRVNQITCVGQKAKQVRI